jgi:hypothetical protein
LYTFLWYPNKSETDVSRLHNITQRIRPFVVWQTQRVNSLLTDYDLNQGYPTNLGNLYCHLCQFSETNICLKDINLQNKLLDGVQLAVESIIFNLLYLIILKSHDKISKSLK